MSRGDSAANTPVTRRALVEALAAIFLLARPASAQNPPGRSGPIFERDLPDVMLKDWSVTAVEVSVRAGPGFSCPPAPRHHHRIRPGGGDRLEDRRRARKELYGRPDVPRDTRRASRGVPKRQLHATRAAAGHSAGTEGPAAHDPGERLRGRRGQREARYRSRCRASRRDARFASNKCPRSVCTNPMK